MIEFLTQMGVAKQYAGDVWLLIVFIIIGIVLSILVNRKNLGVLVLSVYIAFFINASSYFISDSGSVKAISFGIIVFLVFNGIKRAFSFSVGGNGISKWVKVIILALIAVGMIGSVILGWFSEKELEEFFTPLSQKLLISKEARLFWSVAPCGILIAFNNRRK